jgi:cystathionine beta-lyase
LRFSTTTGRCSRSFFADPILERGRLAFSPGPQFGPQGAGFARLNLGTSPALVEEAVERIRRAIGRA